MNETPANASKNPPAPGSPPPTRSTVVTFLAWLVMIVSALATSISVISFLMLLARSYGTSTGGLLDWFIVLAGPPVSLLAGIGLLRRKRWAWFCIAGILLGVLAWQAFQMAFPPPSTTTTHVSPSGVPTTVLGNGPTYSLPIIAVCIAMLAVLFSRRSRAEFAPGGRVDPSGDGAKARAANFGGKESARTWRVGHTGRDQMYYEEWRDGEWQRIGIDGEMLMGRAHQVIYFASPERWASYPEWARHRRDEIMARIKGEFPAPDYEYAGGGTTGRAVAIPSRAPATAKLPPATPRQRRALLLAVALVLAIAGGMAWLVSSGLQKGETYFPGKRSSQQRTVSRAKEPAMFWVSISLYSAIGLGALGLAVWGIRQK